MIQKKISQKSPSQRPLPGNISNFNWDLTEIVKILYRKIGFMFNSIHNFIYFPMIQKKYRTKIYNYNATFRPILFNILYKPGPMTLHIIIEFCRQISIHCSMKHNKSRESHKNFCHRGFFWENISLFLNTYIQKLIYGVSFNSVHNCIHFPLIQMKNLTKVAITALPSGGNIFNFNWGLWEFSKAYIWNLIQLHA